MWQNILQQTSRQQEQFDRQVEAWLTGYRLTGGNVPCGRGCSACCTLAVNCSFPEALAIARNLAERQREEVGRHARLLLETAAACGDLRSYLQRKRRLGPCPFLDDQGACSIHPQRPISCRALISTKESRWCAVDFSTLSPGEKQSFMASLDRRVADFPLHYAAFPRARGEEGEQFLLQLMAEQFGFAFSGALPYLVWLEQEHALSALMAGGHPSIGSVLAQKQLLHPFLTHLAPIGP
jgi:Fe-S-cluster containining protein